MARRTKHEDYAFALDGQERATIVVVADTHSRPHPEAAARIAEREPHCILHAGDVGDASVVDALSEIAPCVAVRGNIDDHALPDSVAMKWTNEGDPLITILLTHIAVAGPRLRSDARRLAERHGASVVVCGHSHVPFFSSDGGMTVFNPGSIGPRRFSLPITFGVISLGVSGLSVHHVDCETGERWLPPG